VTIVTLPPAYSELRLTLFEAIVATSASVLLITWPFGAPWLSQRAFTTPRRVRFVPLVAAVVCLLILAIPLSLKPVELTKLPFVLICCSSAAASGSCLVVLGLATAGLRTSTRLLAALLLVELLYFGVVGLTLMPFGVTETGWWVEPNPLFTWVPLITAFAVPALLIRRNHSALP
jgi:hypothetical protein